MLPARQRSPRSRRPDADGDNLQPGDCAPPRTVISSFALLRPYSKLTADELLGLCADRGNMQAWEEFLRRFDPLVMTTVRRTVRRYTEPHLELCEDLVQQVYLKLNDHDARLLREFVPAHQDASFGFIKVVTANAVHDYFKGKGRYRFEPLPEDIPGGGAPNSDNHLLLLEVDNFLRRQVSERDREIFWFHNRQGMTAHEIAALEVFKLTLKGVETVLKKVKDLVMGEFSDKQPKACSEAVSEDQEEAL